MKKPRLALALALTAVMACDRSPGKLDYIPEGRPLPEVVVTPAPNSGPGADALKSVKAEKEELPLNLIPGAGSEMRFLDGNALTVFYANIFPKRAYGYEICANVTDLTKLPAEASACTESIFNATESPAMGTFSMNLAPNRGAQNVQPAQNLTLNYMRTLRAALSRECSYLVKTERAKLTANDAAANILVKGPAPKAEDLEEFFRTMLGLKGTGIKVDVAAADYVTAFDKVVAAAGAGAADKLKAADEAYLGLCIALAMNPHVILY